MVFNSASRVIPPAPAGLDDAAKMWRLCDQSRRQKCSHFPQVARFDPHSRMPVRLPRDQGDPAGGQRRLSARAQDRDQYLLWLSEAEANRLAARRRRGESYSDAVIRMAQEAARLAFEAFSLPSPVAGFSSPNGASLR
jgi:hypothetical protein